jgi:hypothetical protein
VIEYQPIDEHTRSGLRQMSARNRWDILAGMIVDRRRLIEQARADLAEAEQWLTQEMRAQDPPAVEVRTDGWTIKLSDRQTYTYDDEALSELQGYLTPQEYDEVVQPIMTLKWNKVALNKLHKAGGVLARVIDQGIKVASKRTDVEIKRRG